MSRSVTLGRSFLIAAVIVSASALCMLQGCGSVATSRTDGLAAAGDAAQVTLGGYTFGSSSNVLTHPYFPITQHTPTWVGKGWGTEKGKQATVSFSSGGLVRKVATLKLTFGPRKQYRWMAQDSQGNIHYLMGKDGTGPAWPEGVAAGLPPSFFLVRDARLTVGYVWYNYGSPGVKEAQHKVLSRTATVRGKSKLLLLREVDDSNHDGVFDSDWGGPDNRTDFYFQPQVGMWAVQVTSSGGYAG